jgi:hypothetical protein
MFKRQLSLLLSSPFRHQLKRERKDLVVAVVKPSIRCCGALHHLHHHDRSITPACHIQQQSFLSKSNRTCIVHNSLSIHSYNVRTITRRKFGTPTIIPKRVTTKTTTTKTTKTVVSKKVREGMTKSNSKDNVSTKNDVKEYKGNDLDVNHSNTVKVTVKTPSPVSSDIKTDDDSTPIPTTTDQNNDNNNNNTVIDNPCWGTPTSCDLQNLTIDTKRSNYII